MPRFVRQQPAGAGRIVRRQPEIPPTEEAVAKSVIEGLWQVETGTKTATRGVHYISQYERKKDLGEGYREYVEVLRDRRKNPDKYREGEKAYSRYLELRRFSEAEPFVAYAERWRDDFRRGHAPEQYWTRLQTFSWRIRENVGAVKAIEAWLEGLTIAECATVLYAIHSDTVRGTLGNAYFDELYGALPTSRGGIRNPHRLTVSDKSEYDAGNAALHFLAPTPRARQAMKDEKAAGEKAQEAGWSFSEAATGSPNRRPLKKGDWVYFRNHPKYLLKHPAGAFKGENALYLGSRKGVQLYAGFGVGALTEEALLQKMAKAYNEPRSEYDFRWLVDRYARGRDKGTGSWQQVYAEIEQEVPTFFREGGYPKTIDAVELVAAPPSPLPEDLLTAGMCCGRCN